MIFIQLSSRHFRRELEEGRETRDSPVSGQSVAVLLCGMGGEGCHAGGRAIFPQGSGGRAREFLLFLPLREGGGLWPDAPLS